MYKSSNDVLLPVPQVHVVGVDCEDSHVLYIVSHRACSRRAVRKKTKVDHPDSGAAGFCHVRFDIIGKKWGCRP